MSGPGEVVIASAPMRISLAGGGTDLPSYAERFGGLVIGLAIDRRVAVTVSPRPLEDSADPLEEGYRIDHEELARDGFATTAIARVGAERQWMSCVSEAPPRSGLGGSGAFLVALVQALRGSRAVAPAMLAEEASRIEIEDLRRPVGKQDHYLAALGGMWELSFGGAGRVGAEPILLGRRLASYLTERLLLFHTGLGHDAGDVLALQDERTRRSDGLTLAKLDAIRGLVEPMREALRHERVDEIGPILAEHWRHKAQLSDAVIVPRVAALHALALASGAEGGKLVGAGGGGFLLLSCRAGEQQRLRAAMDSAGATELPFAPTWEGAVVGREPRCKVRDAVGVKRGAS